DRGVDDRFVLAERGAGRGRRSRGGGRRRSSLRRRCARGRRRSGRERRGWLGPGHAWEDAHGRRGRLLLGDRSRRRGRLPHHVVVLACRSAPARHHERERAQKGPPGDQASAAIARSMRTRTRSWPSVTAVSKSGGAFVVPVIATRIAPKSWPVLTPSRSASARKRSSSP